VGWTIDNLLNFNIYLLGEYQLYFLFLPLSRPFSTYNYLCSASKQDKGKGKQIDSDNSSVNESDSKSDTDSASDAGSDETITQEK